MSCSTKLLGMSEEEAFSMFLAGLAPLIQEQVGAQIQGDLSAAITMVERLGPFFVLVRRKVMEAVVEPSRKGSGVDQ